MSNAWDAARLGGLVGRSHALGRWQTIRGLASLAWLPPASERRKIAGKRRYVYVFNFAAPYTNSVARVTMAADFWPTDWSTGGIFTNPGTFDLYDTKNEIRFNNVPAFNFNASGQLWGPIAPAVPSYLPAPAEAPFPYFERRMAKIPKGTVLLCTFQTTGSLTKPPQLALGGYQDA